MTAPRKTPELNGHSRAMQNRQIRRDALREELKSREYIRQVLTIAERLDPEAANAYRPEDVPRAKERAAIYFRLLDKTLPNLRPVDVSIQMPYQADVSAYGKAVLASMAAGEVTPSEGSQILAALASQVRITEAAALVARLERPEQTLAPASEGRLK